MDLRDFPSLTFKNDVIIFDDVLFLHQEHSKDGQFEYLLGNKKLAKLNIINFKSNLNNNIEIAKKYDFFYRHVVFPCKPIAYSQKFLNIGIKLHSLFQDEHKHDLVVYPSLSENCFHQYDTHNNDYGMWEIIKIVFSDFFKEEIPLPVFKPCQHQGDLQTMLKEENNTSTVEQLVAFVGYSADIQHYGIRNALQGNTNDMRYSCNKNALYNKVLLLFGDSFFTAAIPILSLLFSDVIYFRSAYILEEIVNNIQPDIVLTGNAERYLCSVPNSNYPQPWFLHYLSNKNFDNSQISDETYQAFYNLFTRREYFNRKKRQSISLDSNIVNEKNNRRK